MHKFYTCLLLLTCASICSGQLRFTDKTDSYNISHVYGNGTAGGGVSFIDFDNDGLDDLSMANSDGNSISFYLNQVNKLLKIQLPIQTSGEIKHILWIDFDNDGDKDLFVTYIGKPNKLIRNNGGWNFEDVTYAMGLPVEHKYGSFGATWADFNRDGWLDLYYGVRRVEVDGLPNHNRLFYNNGNQFIEKTTVGDAEDSGKTPFCSGAIDIDNDKWPDIYTAHDRKRGNTMLKNNDGVFEDVSIETHTDLKMDGMSMSIGDYNNDGFQDFYISNSEAGNALFVNQNGKDFKNLSAEKGVAFNSVAWGTNFLDGDNDGDQDLYVSGMLVGSNAVNSRYYENLYPIDSFIKGEKIPSDTVSSFNNAVGDINNDGYPEIAVINVSNFPSLFFENVGGSNNFIKVKLQGVASNRDGIGSTIVAYNKNMAPQHIYTTTGIGFMGQNTDNYMIGLGQNAKCDSLKVLWSSGHVDILYNISAKSRLKIKEGSTNNNVINVDSDFNPLNVSASHVEKEPKISITPNPIIGSQFSILLEDGECVSKVEFMDNEGKLALVYRPINNVVDCPSLPHGIYHLRIKLCSGLYVIKTVTIL